MTRAKMNRPHKGIKGLKKKSRAKKKVVPKGKTQKSGPFQEKRASAKVRVD
jgi:hypothetical protein